MKSGNKSPELKKAVKAALVELLEERQDLLLAAVKEAIEDAGLVRAMDEADRTTVSRDKIDDLLKRGR